MADRAVAEPQVPEQRGKRGAASESGASKSASCAGLSLVAQPFSHNKPSCRLRSAGRVTLLWRALALVRALLHA